MKELNNKPEVADVSDEETACCCDSSESTPLVRKSSSSTPFSKMKKGQEKLQAIGSSDKCESSSMSCCGIRAF